MVRSSVYTITEVLCKPHYFINVLITIVITGVANFCIDYFMTEDKNPQFYVWCPEVFMDIMLMIAIVTTLIFFSSFVIHNAIRSGSVKPMAEAALTSVCGRLFYPIAVPRWKARFPLFLCLCFVFPGAVCAAGVVFGCWAHLGFPGAFYAHECPTTQTSFALLMLVWKIPAVTVIYTLNYVAAHNDAQPEVQTLDHLDFAHYGTSEVEVDVTGLK